MEGVWENWEHMDSNVEFLCSFFHSLQQILRNQCIMSRDECQGREKAYSWVVFFFFLGYERLCPHTNTHDITIADHSNSVIQESKFTYTHEPWEIYFSEYMVNNGLEGIIFSFLWSLCFPVPSCGPTNVSAFATTSSSILVRWFEVPEPDRNGLILGYKVCLCFLWFTVVRHLLFSNL